MPKKKKTYIVIPGDPVSAEELFLSIDKKRLSDLCFEMEKIRTSDTTEDQKRIARSKISWQIDALKRRIFERS